MTDSIDRVRFVSHYKSHFARYGATFCGSPLGRFRVVVENGRVSCGRCRVVARAELARLCDRIEQVTKARDETVNSTIERLLSREIERLKTELERIERSL